MIKVGNKISTIVHMYMKVDFFPPVAFGALTQFEQLKYWMNVFSVYFFVLFWLTCEFEVGVVFVC